MGFTCLTKTATRNHWQTATGRSLPGQNKDKSQAAMLVLRA
jgi:hypothetical protein